MPIGSKRVAQKLMWGVTQVGESGLVLQADACTCCANDLLISCTFLSGGSEQRCRRQTLRPPRGGKFAAAREKDCCSEQQRKSVLLHRNCLNEAAYTCAHVRACTVSTEEKHTHTHRCFYQSQLALTLTFTLTWTLSLNPQALYSFEDLIKCPHFASEMHMNLTVGRKAALLIDI